MINNKMREAFLLPNLITLSNLLSGCIAVVLSFSGHLAGSSVFILAAALFDFLDGMAARALNMKTLIGKDLDSLADVISFGLAPSCIIYHLFFLNGLPPGPEIGGMPVLPFISFLIAAMAAVRLAEFNNDPKQSHDFRGLPTPAAGIFIASFPVVVIYADRTIINLNLSLFLPLITHATFLIIVTLVISFLMISRISFFSFKFSSFSINKNKIRYTFLFISLFLLIITGFASLFFILLLYIIFPIFLAIADKIKMVNK